MNYRILPFGLLFLVLSSCFKDDEQVPAYNFYGQTYQATLSIYDYQIFVDLESNTTAGVSEAEAWQLAFESDPDGKQIVVNGSDNLAIATTASKQFDSVFPAKSPDYTWLFDRASGNPDSTAVGEWFDTETGTSDSVVYILGQNDGTFYNGFAKMQVFPLNRDAYIIKVADLDSAHGTIDTVYKNNLVNFVAYNIQQREVVSVEPSKDEWDLLLTQYSDILFTDEGMPTPYSVRGVLLNPYQTKALALKLENPTYFDSIDRDFALSQNFSDVLNIIGYDWKSVEINENQNTALYGIRQNMIYLVKTAQNNYFKLRFVGYNNEAGERGYPAFEFVLLE